MYCGYTLVMGYLAHGFRKKCAFRYAAIWCVFSIFFRYGKNYLMSVRKSG